ncbi:NAD(P)/FAD-dependent oxidoreductase [Geomicrobium sp. JCM 19038]|uniref:NAD(P)/FAD-dependent oxidoreductase n=1 Tax=Geomicrobium sp. JCM 19038 TaxID=1460635 RepID=UPI00045F1EA1|nr:NAD(P)/FAD-dependent oxidoreductase [Geomicrobium sp. JCM 19038]GAK06877.1 thioredoxin reductase [Geomicrobium sp. JCM 19038]
MGNDLELYDVTVVGGGPAGLYSAFYSGMRDLKTKIIESEPHLGGKLNVYPDKTIWDIGALPPTKTSEVIQNLSTQATTFEPTVVCGEKVTDITKNHDGTFVIETSLQRKHFTKAIILATGYGILRQAKLTVQGAEAYETENLYYEVPDIEQFRGKDVVISGGGNSAVDWANELEPIAKSVTVVHRRDAFGGHEQFVTKMKNSRVNVMTPFAISGLTGCNQGKCIEQVQLEHCESKSCQIKRVDAVVVNHGFEVELSFLEHEPLGLKVEESKLQLNDRMQTNVPGIFAAGDLANYNSKLPLIAGCFQDAALAVNSVKQYVEPTANEYGMVSSHHEKLTQ